MRRLKANLIPLLMVAAFITLVFCFAILFYNMSYPWKEGIHIAVPTVLTILFAIELAAIFYYHEKEEKEHFRQEFIRIEEAVRALMDDLPDYASKEEENEDDEERK